MDEKPGFTPELFVPKSRTEALGRDGADGRLVVEDGGRSRFGLTVTVSPWEYGDRFY